MENQININLNWAIVLCIIFVILKLCKVIAWSWLWVLSPLWISAALFLIVFIIGLIIAIRNN